MTCFHFFVFVTIDRPPSRRSWLCGRDNRNYYYTLKPKSNSVARNPQSKVRQNVRVLWWRESLSALNYTLNAVNQSVGCEYSSPSLRVKISLSSKLWAKGHAQRIWVKEEPGECLRFFYFPSYKKVGEEGQARTLFLSKLCFLNFSMAKESD